MNLTLAVDDDTLKRARIRALQENTSVNAVVREYLTTDAAIQAIDAFLHFQVQALHSRQAYAAMLRNQSSQLSYWDALIVETALHAGADTLYTEDFRNGRKIDGPQIVNPVLTPD